MQTVPEEIQSLIERGALFVINHSAGKDSQAMALYLRRIVPHTQLLVIHADLPEVDWDGLVEHIETTCPGLPLRVVRASKTLLEMVEHRGMFPSPKYRQCTSDLKRGPLEKEIRSYLKEHPEFGGLIVNCMGMRAEESSNRAKLTTFKFDKGNSKAGREWYEWLPIHGWTTEEVFQAIADAGQEPLWVYAEGMSRASCVFCIMASKKDLQTAARLKPDLYRRYVHTERRLGVSMLMPGKDGQPQWLEDVVGIPVSELEPADDFSIVAMAQESAQESTEAEAVELVAKAVETALEPSQEAQESAPKLNAIQAVHGTPITPKPALQQMQGASFRASHFRPKRLDPNQLELKFAG